MEYVRINIEIPHGVEQYVRIKSLTLGEEFIGKITRIDTFNPDIILL